jgi:DNA-binding transcriptional ArsR family regulator
VEKRERPGDGAASGGRSGARSGRGRPRVEAQVPPAEGLPVHESVGDDVGSVPPPAPGLERTARRRRPATAAEAKALGHPLRIRILRLCLQAELTNKQLADRLGNDPGTVLYHVRQLVAAGLLAPAEVRTGSSGALEKPYRSTGVTWWLDGPLNDEPPEVRYAPVEAFLQELSEAGPASVATFERFYLHLSDEEVVELDRRILEILDEYVATDDERRGQPGRRAQGGVFVLHRLAEAPNDTT